MFECWVYQEKNKTKEYKLHRKESAGDRILAFQSEDPEMPWYARDPKEVKRDSRYQQLTRYEKDLFNRLVDELWIHKGALGDNVDFIASCLEIDDRSEARMFIDKCVATGIIKRHAGRIFMPELREQYVRTVLKSAIRDTTGNDPNDGDDH